MLTLVIPDFFFLNVISYAICVSGLMQASLSFLNQNNLFIFYAKKINNTFHSDKHRKRGSNAENQHNNGGEEWICIEIHAMLM